MKPVKKATHEALLYIIIWHNKIYALAHECRNALYLCPALCILAVSHYKVCDDTQQVYTFELVLWLQEAAGHKPQTCQDLRFDH